MQIYFLLTERCNLNCKMCIRGDKKSNDILLADLQNLKCIGEFAEHDIVVTGGEPTLCKDFIPIVSFLSQIARSVTVCTNGTTDYYIGNTDFPIETGIQISLDGIEAVHNNIRGVASYGRIIETINKLDLLNMPYTISSVVSKTNVSCMKSLSDELSRLKCMKYWNVSYEMPFGYAQYNDLMSTEEWNTFVDEILDYVCFKMKIQKMFPFDLFDKHKEKLDDFYKSRKCSNCGSGRNKIYIYPDFSVYPCTCLTDFKLGNLNDESLAQIMHNENAKLFSDYTVHPESKCASCEYLRYCNGGCIGMSYHYFHKLGCGDMRCPRIRK